MRILILFLVIVSVFFSFSFLIFFFFLFIFFPLFSLFSFYFYFFVFFFFLSSIYSSLPASLTSGMEFPNIISSHFLFSCKHPRLPNYTCGALNINPRQVTIFAASSFRQFAAHRLNSNKKGGQDAADGAI